MSRLRFLLGATVLTIMVPLVPVISWAESFVVKDIRFQGLQRVAPDYAYSLLTVRAGQSVDTESEQIAQLIRRIFDSGNFDDVQVSRESDVLVIKVVERPSISEIVIEGNDSIPDDQLFDGLKNIGLEEGAIFKRTALESIRKDLERSYLAQGRYGAGVKTNVEPQPRNQVKIEIDVREGSNARIEEIDIIGNEQFDNELLLKQMELSASGFWSFVSSNDKYARDRLGADIERLRSFYLERGYLAFDFEQVQVSVTPDREKVYIALFVTEGQPYKVTASEFVGNLPVEQSELEAALAYSPGEVYKQSSVSESETAMLNLLGDLGYYYARVNAQPQLDEEGHTAKLIYQVIPGEKVYVRDIVFKGNIDTSDEVLRREMRQLEGAPADKSEIDFSKAQLQRLGYLQSVDIAAMPVAGEPDLMDLEVTVEERPSGEFTANLGFSESVGFSFGLGVSQKNFLGSGNSASFSVNKDQARTSFNMSFTNPYYTPSGISRGWGAYYSETNFDDVSNSTLDWSIDRLGGYLNFGYPVGDYERVTLGFGVDNSKIISGIYTAIDIENYIEENGDNYLNFTTELSWRRNTLNRGFLPTSGLYTRLGAEVAVPGSDSPYYILDANIDRYFELSDRWSLLVRGDTAYGNSLTDGSGLPFFKNFYSGGLGSVRGYRRNTLGPESPRAIALTQFDENGNVVTDENGDRVYDLSKTDQFPNAIGGNFKLHGGLDLIFPMPFFEDYDNVRTSIFYDIGNVYLVDSPDLVQSGDPNEGFDYKQLRSSYGITLSAYTFVGPLTFSLGQAINPKSGDERKFFQFSLGQTF